MKYNELYRKLKKAGCYIKRNGKRHDIWYNPTTGLETAVPRHGSAEVLTKTLNSIYQGLGL